ncbi:hypothetical protein ACFE04_029612 [Oxalis oulophora]
MSSIVKEKKTQGRKKIELKEIENKAYKNICFSKRKDGILKKATELSILTGAEVAFLAFSPTGKAHSYGHPSLESVAHKYFHLPPPNVTDNQSHDNRAYRIEELSQQINQLRTELEVQKERETTLQQFMKNTNLGQSLWQTPLSKLDRRDVLKMKYQIENLYKKLLECRLKESTPIPLSNAPPAQLSIVYEISNPSSDNVIAFEDMAHLAPFPNTNFINLPSSNPNENNIYPMGYEILNPSSDNVIAFEDMANLAPFSNTNFINLPSSNPNENNIYPIGYEIPNPSSDNVIAFEDMSNLAPFPNTNFMNLPSSNPNENNIYPISYEISNTFSDNVIAFEDMINLVPFPNTNFINLPSLNPNENNIYPMGYEIPNPSSVNVIASEDMTNLALFPNTNFINLSSSNPNENNIYPMG